MPPREPRQPRCAAASRRPIVDRRPTPAQRDVVRDPLLGLVERTAQLGRDRIVAVGPAAVAHASPPRSWRSSTLSALARHRHQLGARVVQPGPGGVLGAFRDLRHLFDRQALDLEQHQHQLLLRGQLGDQLVQHPQPLAALRSVGRRGRQRLAQQQARQHGPDAAAARRARRVTGGNPVDPGRQSRLAAEVRQAAIDRHEHFLAGVLALLGRHAERRQEPVDHRGVAVVQRAPGAPVALLASRQDVEVGAAPLPRWDRS